MLTRIIFFIPLLILFTGDAISHKYPDNSLGPMIMVQGIYGLSYERVLSDMFCLNAVACISGDVDFLGFRVMLSRNDTSMLFRPSLGLCMGRGRSDEGHDRDKSPWYGFIWPGIGFNIRSNRMSFSIDASLGYGSNSPGGSLNSSFLTVSGAVMYMF